jgi:hypothetical protein
VGKGWDDEQLPAALREAMTACQTVPIWFVEAGKNACAWHNIDAGRPCTVDSAQARNGTPAGSESLAAHVVLFNVKSTQMTTAADPADVPSAGDLGPRRYLAVYQVAREGLRICMSRAHKTRTRVSGAVRGGNRETTG